MMVSQIHSGRSPNTSYGCRETPRPVERAPARAVAAVANRISPPGVTAVLVIAIAYQLAGLTWALVPGSSGGATIIVPTAPRSRRRRTANS